MCSLNPRLKKEEAVEQLDLFFAVTNQPGKTERKKRRNWSVNANGRKQCLPSKGSMEKMRSLKGMNLQEGATAKDRNGKIGGHKA